MGLFYKFPSSMILTLQGLWEPSLQLWMSAVAERGVDGPKGFPCHLDGLQWSWVGLMMALIKWFIWCLDTCSHGFDDGSTAPVDGRTIAKFIIIVVVQS